MKGELTTAKQQKECLENAQWRYTQLFCLERRLFKISLFKVRALFFLDLSQFNFGTNFSGQQQTFIPNKTCLLLKQMGSFVKAGNDCTVQKALEK